MICQTHATDADLAGANVMDVVACGDWCHVGRKDRQYSTHYAELMVAASLTRSSPNRTAAEVERDELRERVQVLERALVNAQNDIATLMAGGMLFAQPVSMSKPHFEGYAEPSTSWKSDK